MTKENWSEIHREFGDVLGEQYQKSWESEGFSYEETKAWIEGGLTPFSYEFANFLKKDGYRPSDLSKNDLEELRRKCSWKYIRWDFTFDERRKWEEQGCDYQEVKKWVGMGFGSSDYNYNHLRKWSEKGFSFDETKQWTNTKV